MKKIKAIMLELINTINFDGIRCTIKGDPSFREVMNALKREKEIEINKTRIKN